VYFVEERHAERWRMHGLQVATVIVAHDACGILVTPAGRMRVEHSPGTNMTAKSARSLLF
jgi:hypothetical protein